MRTQDTLVTLKLSYELVTRCMLAKYFINFSARKCSVYKPQNTLHQKYTLSMAWGLASVSYPDLREVSYPDLRKVSYSDLRKVSYSDLRKVSYSDLHKVSYPDLCKVSHSDVHKVSYATVEKCNGGMVQVWV